MLGPGIAFELQGLLALGVVFENYDEGLVAIDGGFASLEELSCTSRASGHGGCEVLVHDQDAILGTSTLGTTPLFCR